MANPSETSSNDTQNDKLQNSSESQQNGEKSDKSKGLGRLLKKIGHGMKEVGKGVFNVVKEVAKVPVALVKGVDQGLSQIPLAGDIYRGGKETMRGVWGVTEKVPIIEKITQGLREGSAAISEKMGFTEPEKTRINKDETELMQNIRTIRNSIARDIPDSNPLKQDVISVYDDILDGKDPSEKIKAITEKNPAIAKIVKEITAEKDSWKTGKGGMSNQDLIKEERGLSAKLLQLSKNKNAEKKSEIAEKEYTDFQKQFTGLPEFGKMEKKSDTYRLLQNMYFGRNPRPDLQDPLVKDFIQKSVTLSVTKKEDTASMKKAYSEHREICKQKSREIAQVFHFSEFEKTDMELSLNRQERINRLPPRLPHEYNGPDFGMNNLYDTVHKDLFPELHNPDQVKASLIARKEISEYRGLALSVFQGGGH